MRRAAKRDGNEPAIIAALERVGCRVWRISSTAGPDLLVLTRKGSWLPVEIKNPAGLNRLTPAQRAADAPWPVVRSANEARAAVKSASARPKRLTEPL